MRMRGNQRRNCSANAISYDLNFVMRAPAVVCVVCGGSALRNLDILTLEVCLCLFFHCLRMASGCLKLYLIFYRGYKQLLQVIRKGSCGR